jgi:glycine/D-amino acid oxidase-like deaminating enzyme
MSLNTDPIVIIGGGIIGCSCAYFLSTHPSISNATTSRRRIILIESAPAVAPAASGRAGGLLAKWAYPACIVPLSFRLHAELATKLDGEKRWGYRVLDGCWDVSGEVRGKGEEEREGNVLEAEGDAREGVGWMDRLGDLCAKEMAPKGETAQVHPLLLTRVLAEEAERNGLEIVRGTVDEILMESLGGKSSGKKQSRVTGVRYTPHSSSSSSPQDKTLTASTVILATGPWTPRLLPSAPITAARAHSVVIKPTHPIPAHALFTNLIVPNPLLATNTLVSKLGHKNKNLTHTVQHPEFYPRPDGTVYACGATDALALPSSATDVVVDAARVETLLAQVRGSSTALRDGEVLAEQACYLPHMNAVKPGPIVGPSSRTEGLVIAAGHTCWGIQNSLGTGCVVAEMVLDGETKSADVSELEPKNWGL